MILTADIGAKFLIRDYRQKWIDGVYRTIGHRKQEVLVLTSTPWPGYHPWWVKMAMFDPNNFPPNEVVYWVDLDVVFLKDFGGLMDAMDRVAYETGAPIVSIRDFHVPNQNNGSLYRIDRGRPAFDKFYAEHLMGFSPPPEGLFPTGDQQWLTKNAMEYMAFLDDRWTCSYKAAKEPEKWLQGRRNDPKLASLLVFHGRPMPHEVAEDPQAFLHDEVLENW